MSRLKKKLLAFTGHGIPDMVDAESLKARLIWLTFIVIASAGCFYSILENIIEFAGYDVVTNIKVFYESKLSFPAITICMLGFKDFQNLHLIEFEFNGQDYLNSSLMENFTIEGQLFNFSRCFTFNSKKLASEKEVLHSEVEGFTGGLILKFYVHPEEMNQSLHFYFHDNSVMPIDYETFISPTLFQSTKLALEKTVQYSLSHPYNDCLNLNEISFYDSDLVRKTLSSGYSYRRQNCYQKCYEKYKTISKPSKNFDYHSVCSEHCPLECEVSSFKIFEYSQALTKKTVDDLCKRTDQVKAVGEKFNLTNFTLDDFQERFTQVYVFFPKLEYTEISQIPKTTVFDLISSVGGSLGLFMGLSLMSFVQLFNILIEAYYSLGVKIF